MALAHFLASFACCWALAEAGGPQQDTRAHQNQRELMRKEPGQINKHTFEGHDFNVPGYGGVSALEIGGASALEVISRSSQHRWNLDTWLLKFFGFFDSEMETAAEFQELEETLKLAGWTENRIEGHSMDSGQLSLQTNKYDEWAKSMKLNTICETGFNAGHSALRFLAQSKAHLYEFDLGQWPYSKVAADFLTSKFPERLDIMWGDSNSTLPRFHAEHSDVMCDLIIVDGGHFNGMALADLTNFAAMASKNHILAIDDTPCTYPFCEEPGRAWKKLISMGCIEQTSATPMGTSRGFSVGRYKPCSQWPNAHGLA